MAGGVEGQRGLIDIQLPVPVDEDIVAQVCPLNSTRDDGIGSDRRIGWRPKAGQGNARYALAGQQDTSSGESVSIFRSGKGDGLTIGLDLVIGGDDQQVAANCQRAVDVGDGVVAQAAAYCRARHNGISSIGAPKQLRQRWSALHW